MPELEQTFSIVNKTLQIIQLGLSVSLLGDISKEWVSETIKRDSYQDLMNQRDAVFNGHCTNPALIRELKSKMLFYITYPPLFSGARKKVVERSLNILHENYF